MNLHYVFFGSIESVSMGNKKTRKNVKNKLSANSPETFFDLPLKKNKRKAIPADKFGEAIYTLKYFVV